MSITDLIGAYGLVPVAVIHSSDSAPNTAKALCEGGLPLIEVTMRTETACESIRKIAAQVPEMNVGAGTVLTLERCKEAVEAGAKFIVAPGFNEEVVSWCCRNKVPVLPGAVTPTEIDKALRYGLRILKFFPANVYGGLKGCEALNGPYGSSGVKYIPTGGVSNENIGEYIRRPFIHAVGGSWICPASAVDAGDFDLIRAKTQEAIRAMLGFETAHVGVYCGDREAAAKDAAALAAMFGFSVTEGNSSLFASAGIELCKGNTDGEKGHIAISTNSVPRAAFYLEKQGYAIDTQRSKYENGQLKVAYLAAKLSGFSLHLTGK